MRHIAIIERFYIKALFFLESDRKPSKPGGSFKLTRYDENFDQVIYDIYENNLKTRTLMAGRWARWARIIEKDQILSFKEHTDKKWTVFQEKGKIFFTLIIEVVSMYSILFILIL